MLRVVRSSSKAISKLRNMCQQNHTFRTFTSVSVTKCFMASRNLKIINCNLEPRGKIVRFNTLSTENIPLVTIAQIKKILRENNFTFEDGYTCIKIDCPLCRQSGTTANKMYINKTTGFFICYQCNRSGKWDAFEKIAESKKRKKSISDEEYSKLDILLDSTVSFRWEEIEKKRKLLSSLPSQEIKQTFSDFNLPYVDLPLKCFEARIDDDKTALYFPLRTLDGKVSGYKVLHKNSTEEETVPPGNSYGVITFKRGKASKSAVLVSSLLDAIALIPYSTVVCLPYGLAHLPQEILPCLEQYNKLILWFGNDSSSWETARIFAKKLKEERCFFVRPTEKNRLPHVVVSAGIDPKEIISAAQPVWHKSITTFSCLREDVLAELQNIDKVEGVKWKRYPALNKILKGHRRGEFTVLTGPTGSGKTTFISEYSLDLAMQGVNTLWGSFEIRNVRLARTMLQQMAGVPLEANLDKYDFWADQFEKLPLYFMTFHGQQSVKVVMEAVEHATYVHDIAHVIVDNVQFMMGISDEPSNSDRFWKQDAIIANFRTFATKKNCHVTLVIHPRKERDTDELTSSSIFGSAKASQEADNILIIQDKRLTSVRGKKYLQVAKNRYTGDLGVMPLEFDKGSLSYGQRKKKKSEDTAEKKNIEAEDTAEKKNFENDSQNMILDYS